MIIAIITQCLLVTVTLQNTIWDNILSRLQTKHRLRLPNSDQMEIQYKRTLSNYVFSIDYDTTHIRASFDMDIAQMIREPILSFKVDLVKKYLKVVSHSRQGQCTNVKLPNSFEVVYQNQTTFLKLTPRTIDTLISFTTGFVKEENGIYVYSLNFGGIGKSERRTKNPFGIGKRLMEQSDLENYTNIESMKMNIADLLFGRSQTSSDDSDDEETPTSDLAFLSTLQPHDTEILLRLQDQSLKEIQIGATVLAVTHQSVHINLSSHKKCLNDDWSDKSFEEIIARVGLMLYPH